MHINIYTRSQRTKKNKPVENDKIYADSLPSLTLITYYLLHTQKH